MMDALFVAMMIVFGLLGLLFTVFGVLGLLSPSRDVSYTSRELFWMTLAGLGDLAAAAFLFGTVF